MCANLFILQLSTNGTYYFSMFGLLRIWGFLWGWFVFLSNHWSPLSVLRLSLSLWLECLYAVNSLCDPYFCFSQFYIVGVDFVTQKTPRENSNEKWHRQKVKRLSEETKRLFYAIITTNETSAVRWYLHQPLWIINSTQRSVEFRCSLLKERSTVPSQSWG